MDTNAPSLEVFEFSLVVLKSFIFGEGGITTSEWEKPTTVRLGGALFLAKVVPAYGQWCWNSVIFKVPSNPDHSMNLWYVIPNHIFKYIHFYQK